METSLESFLMEDFFFLMVPWIKLKTLYLPGRRYVAKLYPQPWRKNFKEITETCMEYS